MFRTKCAHNSFAFFGRGCIHAKFYHAQLSTEYRKEDRLGFFRFPFAHCRSVKYSEKDRQALKAGSGYATR